ncbi:MAG: WD40 repeat protein [Akkermansiaceae bacterium]|jgi:WD40 repeat protein
MTPPTLKKGKEIKLPSHVLDLTLGPDDQLYASCLDGGIYKVSTVKKLLSKPYEEIARHHNYASGINWSASQKTLISSSYDGDLKWINPSEKGEKKETKTVKAHNFWSWQSRISPDGTKVATTTGQYLCGGYKYEPAPETEPSVKVFDTPTGKLLHAFPHTPPVQSVAFSNNGKLLAAGNLMGEVILWDLEQGGKEIARLQTPDFTGWGIIKGHYYTGGVFALNFAPDDTSLYLAGMGSTTDPAAGNGKQLWQKFTWHDGPKKSGAAVNGEIGEGLMETLAFHPSGKFFLMAGRIFKGDWNAALFDHQSGSRIHHQNVGFRISASTFTPDGKTLYLGGGANQGEPDPKKEWGRIVIYEIT